MKDTELYAALLKLPAPWVVREVRLDVAAERVDMWIEAGLPMFFVHRTDHAMPYV